MAGAGEDVTCMALSGDTRYWSAITSGTLRGADHFALRLASAIPHSSTTANQFHRARRLRYHWLATAMPVTIPDEVLAAARPGAERKITSLEADVTIHPRPDQEIKIQHAIEAGLIESAEDLIDVGLERLHERTASTAHPPKSLDDVFASVRGLADDVDFSRSPSTARRVDLA